MNSELLEYLKSYGLDSVQGMNEMETHDWYQEESGPDNSYDAQFICSRCNLRIGINVMKCQEEIDKNGAIRFGQPSCKELVMDTALE